MLTKKITYTDFDGNERTETFYFNLSRTEITELQLSYPGGYAEYIERVVDAGDRPALLEMFKDIISRSYGEKSEDGRRLVKSQELSDAFMQTNAYDELFFELATNEVAATKFITAVMPEIGEEGSKERIIAETKAKIEEKKMASNNAE